MTSTAPIATSTTPAAPSQTPGSGTFGEWLSTGNNRWIAAGGGLLAVALIVVFLLWGAQRKEIFAARALDEARTTAEAGNLPLAASQFQKLITTYAGTDAADEAVMALNQVRLINGQAQLAAGGLNEFIKSGPKAKYLAPAQALLGSALENSNKPLEAAAAFEAAVKDARFPFLKAEYLLQAGLAYETAGKPDQAATAYRTIVTEYKSQPSYTEAEVRLSELTGGKM
jgi:tetratricopeptide (TPR) repeat protein